MLKEDKLTFEGKLTFPKLSIGHCDGMGCGHGSAPCFCEELYASHMAYQKEYNMPWENDNLACKVWEVSFQFSIERQRRLIKKLEERISPHKTGGISDFMFHVSYASMEIIKEDKENGK